MKSVLLKVGVTLIGVLVCEKLYTKAYGDGYSKGVDDALFITTAVAEKLRKNEEESK